MRLRGVISLFACLLILPWAVPAEEPVEETPAAVPATDPACPDCSAEPPARGARIQFDRLRMDAQVLRVSLDQQEVFAEGDVTLEGYGGTFQAAVGRYNAATGEGYLEQATGAFDPFRFAAQSLMLDAKGTKHAHRVRLTTCTHNPPHYQLLTREMVVDAEGNYRAKRAGMELHGHRLLTVPSLRGQIGGEEPVAKPALMVGQSRIDGTYLGTNYTLPLGEKGVLDVEARAGTEGLVRGAVTLSRPLAVAHGLPDGEISLNLTWKEDVENRLTTSDELVDARLEDLTISRLPAAQIALPAIPLRGALRGFSVRTGAGLGRYREQPTNVDETRGQLWGIVRTPAAHIKGLSLYGEFGRRQAFYGNDMNHGTTAAMVTLETALDAPVYFNLSYLRRRENGESPFLFDRVLLSDELYSEVEFPLGKGSPWWLNLANRQDLNTGHSRDFTVTAIYKLDCLGYGLSYNRASKSIGLGVVLNGFGSFRKGAGSLGFSQ